MCKFTNSWPWKIVKEAFSHLSNCYSWATVTAHHHQIIEHQNQAGHIWRHKHQGPLHQLLSIILITIIGQWHSIEHTVFGQFQQIWQAILKMMKFLNVSKLTSKQNWSHHFNKKFALKLAASWCFWNHFKKAAVSLKRFENIAARAGQDSKRVGVGIISISIFEAKFPASQ